MRDLAHRMAIEDLVVSFFWKIDRRETDDIATLFTEDGELILPDIVTKMTTFLTVRGREALTKQWSNRPPNLVTRHAYINLQVRELSATEAEGRCIGIGFRHTGEGFGLPAPIIVADHDDLFLLGPDERWRFRRKRITPVFVSPQLFADLPS